MFLLSLVRSNFVKTDIRHKKLITILDKKGYASRKLLSFKSFIYQEKCAISAKETLSTNVFF